MEGILLRLTLLVICFFGGAVCSNSRAQENKGSVFSQVEIAPPAPIQELRTAPPAMPAVWIPGSWNRKQDQWEWTPGAWRKPPSENVCWTPGYWQKQKRGGFLWIASGWTPVKHGLILPAAVPIPIAMPETKGPRPRSKQPLVFQAGHYEWRGDWVWQPGVYVESIHPNAQWVYGQWTKMYNDKYRWDPAHWQQGT